MASEKTVVNRVAASGLIVLKPEDWWPSEDICEFDLAPLLFKGLLLREKEFRTKLKEINWLTYQNKIVCVYCSTEAIIPMWAYMLVSSAVSPHAKEIFIGNQRQFIEYHYKRHISQMDLTPFTDAKIVVKGCGAKEIPASAYAEIGFRLSTVCKSLMFGEACSTVPVYKSKKNEEKN